MSMSAHGVQSDTFYINIIFCSCTVRRLKASDKQRSTYCGVSGLIVLALASISIVLKVQIGLRTLLCLFWRHLIATLYTKKSIISYLVANILGLDAEASYQAEPRQVLAHGVTAFSQAGLLRTSHNDYFPSDNVFWVTKQEEKILN